MPDRYCAYCGSDRDLTREHLWPASLHTRLLKANGTSQSLFWLRRINAEVQGEPKIRDVCQTCNNGSLSELDNYICALFDRYCVRILNWNEKVVFEYNYHLLKRWLLKMAFNSARIHSSLDLIVYPPLLNYINGSSNSAGRSVQVYLQLSYPGVIPAESLADTEFQDAPALWEPQDNRVGLAHFEVAGVGRKVLRAIHLRSYSFFLAFFEPCANAAAAGEFTKEFLARMPGTVLLQASRQWSNLVCNGGDAWHSYDGARENRFVAG